MSPGRRIRLLNGVRKVLGRARACGISHCHICLTAVGVFIDNGGDYRRADCAVDCAPMLACQKRYSAGDGWRRQRRGNVMSPSRHVPPPMRFMFLLPLLCWPGVVPGIVGLIIAYLLAKRLNNIKGAGVADHEVTRHDDSVARPVFWWRLARRWSPIFLLFSPSVCTGISIDR